MVAENHNFHKTSFYVASPPVLEIKHSRSFGAVEAACAAAAITANTTTTGTDFIVTTLVFTKFALYITTVTAHGPSLNLLVLCSSH